MSAGLDEDGARALLRTSMVRGNEAERSSFHVDEPPVGAVRG